MATIKSIEKRIWDIEGFEVQIVTEDGRDVRDDKVLNKQYEAGRAAKNSYTVNEWRENRFKVQFPGFDVNVLDGNGNKARGNLTLGNLRDTYE